MPTAAPLRRRRPEVVVAVVSWNTRELLAGALAALQGDVRAGRAEVWVIDNASVDGSAQMVRERFGWVHLIASPTNPGFGAAVNVVAAATRAVGAPWLAVANADTAVASDALAALLEAGRADPRAGALAPALRLPDGSLQHSVHPFPSIGVALVLALGLARIRPGLGETLTLDGRWERRVGRRVAWAHGAFLLVRRDAFDAVGGFDPHQFLYAEDLDLAWRLHRAGWHSRYVPEALVDHVHAAAISQLYGEARDARALQSAYTWLHRRRGPVVPVLWAGVNAAGAGLRGLAPGSRAAGSRRQARLHLRALAAARRSAGRTV
ncbi:MAG TPA: glycosyltransferase family 2 protein [Solirubrobacteraceae bacterium]|nr:glycosyltransferase family 2 protein [Solirubrobacteraceae bacterium]